MSTWLRDYLYIPLGGNRLGPVRTYINLTTTMLIGGLWHGANWTFVVWGGLHGTALALERLLSGGELAPSEGPVRRWIRRIVVFHGVCLAWIFFRAPSLQEAWKQLGSLAIWQWKPEYVTALVFVAVYASILFLLDLHLETASSEHVLASRPYAWRVAAGFALGMLITLFGANQDSAFIYFRF